MLEASYPHQQQRAQREQQHADENRDIAGKIADASAVHVGAQVIQRGCIDAVATEPVDQSPGAEQQQKERQQASLEPCQTRRGDQQPQQEQQRNQQHPMHAQRPWGNDASAYRTPCSPCPVRHLPCDTRMTDYAAPKLTEMFVVAETRRPLTPHRRTAVTHLRAPSRTALLKRRWRRDAVRPCAIVVVLAAALPLLARRCAQAMGCAGRLQSVTPSTMQHARWSQAPDCGAPRRPLAAARADD